MRVRMFPLLLLCAMGLAAASRAAEPASLPRQVPLPTSLQKIAAELSRRSQVPVTVSRDLAEQRVTWSFTQDAPLESVLARLAELTDALVFKAGSPEKPRFRLERKQVAEKLEAAWRREGVLRTIQAVLLTAERQPGARDESTFSFGNRFLLKQSPERAGYLRLLTPELLDRLLAEGTLHFPPGAVPASQIRDTAERTWGRILGQEPGDGPPGPRVEATVRGVAKYGLEMRLDLDTPPQYHIGLNFGRQITMALCHFNDEELGLPNTHTNPYRYLQNGLKTAGAPRLPAALQRPLPADLLLPKDHLWHTALLELARVSGLDLVSDGYVARSRSRLRLAPSAVLARKGTPLVEALDSLCQQFQYLWWEHDGTVYFRSRAWAWDAAPEPPDRFLDTWSAAVERRRLDGAALGAMAALTPRQFAGLGTLGWNSRLGPKYGERVQEFLALFAGATPAQQAQLLGPGLLFPAAEPGKPDPRGLFLQTTAGRGEGPPSLRLSFTAARDSATPGVVQVRLALVRKWTNKTDPIDFAFDLPSPADGLSSTH